MTATTGADITEPTGTTGATGPAGPAPTATQPTNEMSTNVTLTAIPTTATPTTATPTTAARRRPACGRLWRRVPQELLFLLLTLPVVVIALTVLSSVFFTGIGLLTVVVGIVVVVAALYAARGFGLVELTRLRWAGQPAITPPRWDASGEPATTLRALLGPLVNGHYWLYLLHGMVVNFVLGLVSWTVTVVWLSVGLGGVSYWFWGRFLTDTDGVWLHDVILAWMLPGTTLPIDPLLAESLFQLALGILSLLTLPFITHGFTVLHQFAARGMLGAWRSEALKREIADLSASRGAAVAAEDQSLRRLERDIHDGPQQRLVRLQMDLATAERKLATDPDAARALIVEAREQAHDTLEELRALSRGLVPPILQDRGLIAGLESLAARSTIPVRLELQVDPALRLPSEIERSAYFVAAELLTNAAKHSRATGIRLHLALRPSPADPSGLSSPSGTPGTTWLDLWVIDDGIGGARLIDAHGLQGLDERLRGLRGVLSVRSPEGGPTAIGAHIPLPAALPVRVVAVS